MLLGIGHRTVLVAIMASKPALSPSNIVLVCNNEMEDDYYAIIHKVIYLVGFRLSSHMSESEQLLLKFVQLDEVSNAISVVFTLHNILFGT